MKKPFFYKALLFGFVAPALLTACSRKDERKELEAREELKVGKVYNPEVQGNDHENRDNQFFVSRNDNKQGQGLETGAPSDTTSTKPQEAQQPVKQ